MHYTLMGINFWFIFGTLMSALHSAMYLILNKNVIFTAEDEDESDEDEEDEEESSEESEKMEVDTTQKQNKPDTPAKGPV